MGGWIRVAPSVTDDVTLAPDSPHTMLDAFFFSTSTSRRIEKPPPADVTPLLDLNSTGH
jgi:hypothetical protein